MQLKLSIELRGSPRAWLVQQEVQTPIIQSGDFELCVCEHDLVQIWAQADPGTGLTLQGLTLGDVGFQCQLHRLPCRDRQGQIRPSAAYIGDHGCIEIDIGRLLHSDWDYENVQYLTLDQVAQEVLGRSTTIKI